MRMHQSTCEFISRFVPIYVYAGNCDWQHLWQRTLNYLLTPVLLLLSTEESPIWAIHIIHVNRMAGTTFSC